MQNLRPTSDVFNQKLFLTRSQAGLDAALFGGSVRSAIRLLKELQPSVSDHRDLAGGLEFAAGSTLLPQLLVLCNFSFLIPSPR